MKRKSSVAMLLGACLTIAAFEPLKAATVTYDWSFTGGESGSGTITVSSAGDSNVVAFSGTFNGSAIAFSGYDCHVTNGLCTDNVLFAAEPILLDGNGIAFNTLEGRTIGIFWNGVSYTAEDAGPSGVTDWNGNFALTPLPAALPLFATGLAGLGLFGWRRKRKGAGSLKGQTSIRPTDQIV